MVFIGVCNDDACLTFFICLPGFRDGIAEVVCGAVCFMLLLYCWRNDCCCPVFFDCVYDAVCKSLVKSPEASEALPSPQWLSIRQMSRSGVRSGEYKLAYIAAGWHPSAGHDEGVGRSKHFALLRISLANNISAILYADPWRPRVGTSCPVWSTSFFLSLQGKSLSTIVTSCRAEVIKIEHPTRGDDTRAWGPPYAKYTEDSGRDGPGESAYFLSVPQPFFAIMENHNDRLRTSTGQPQQEVARLVIRLAIGPIHPTPVGAEMRHSC